MLGGSGLQLFLIFSPFLSGELFSRGPWRCIPSFSSAARRSEFIRVLNISVMLLVSGIITVTGESVAVVSVVDSSCVVLQATANKEMESTKKSRIIAFVICFFFIVDFICSSFLM